MLQALVQNHMTQENPMEPVTLATTALTFLSPYLAKAGEKAVEKVGEKLPEAVGHVWNTIAARFKGKQPAEEAVADLLAKPDDQLMQSTFVNQLRKVLEADPAFAAEFERLLSSAQRQAGDTITNTGSGAVATHGGVAAGAGGIAIGGNVHGNIVQGRPEKKE
jgi:hypothetical protein